MILPRKTAITILSFALLLALAGPWRQARRFDYWALLDFQPRPSSLAESPEPFQPVPIPAPEPGVRDKPAFAQLSGSSPALDGFFKALRRTESDGGVTRILHYGDSPVTADSITSDVRELLQERFGDAGHGFVLIAKPWPWYAHRGIEIHSSGFISEPATQGGRARDGLHGLGGVAFEGGPGAYSILRTESAHDTVEVSYLRQPRGGPFTVHAGGRLLGTVNTANPVLQSGWTAFALPSGARQVKIEVQSGAVRLLGASFEKRSRGVIYNSLGLNGGQIQVIVRYFDPMQWADQLQHQRPDLVIVNYGTNESLFPKYLDGTYPGELRTVIQRIKDALPDVSILIMSPMDHGERDATGRIATAAGLPRVVAIQSAIAAETGCAFFNTFEAMGGEGTMGRWYASQPRLVTADFIHPFPAGARKVGVLLDDALMSGYQRYKSSHHSVLSALRTTPKVESVP